MKRRFSLFTYPMMDMKAAEAELNRRAAAGWQLEKVWMGVLAVFVPAHVPVCYCIDWSDPGRDDGPGYRALLADAGWRLRQRVTCQNIYEAPAGTTPIQTDSVLEYRRFQDRALRRMGGEARRFSWGGAASAAPGTVAGGGGRAKPPGAGAGGRPDGGGGRSC